MIKITNVGKSNRRLIDKGNWVWLRPKESHVMERIAPSQMFIMDSPMFKIEDNYKKKGED